MFLLSSREKLHIQTHCCDLNHLKKNCLLLISFPGFGKKAPEPWDKLFPNASKKSIDLLSKMLVLNPAERITVDEALSHRLLNHYHDPDDEPICVPAFNFDFEKQVTFFFFLTVGEGVLSFFYMVET